MCIVQPSRESCARSTEYSFDMEEFVSGVWVKKKEKKRKKDTNEESNMKLQINK